MVRSLAKQFRQIAGHILFLDGNELQAKSRPAWSDAPRLGPYRASCTKEVQIGRLAFRKGVSLIQKHTACADVANARHIHSWATLPVKPRRRRFVSTRVVTFGSGVKAPIKTQLLSGSGLTSGVVIMFLREIRKIFPANT